MRAFWVGPCALRGWNGAPTTVIPIPPVPILCRWIPMGSLSHRQKFLVRPQQISGMPTTEGGMGITVVGVPEISGTVVGVPENDAGRFLSCSSLSAVSALASETSDVPFCNASVRHVYYSQANQPRTSLLFLTPLFLVSVYYTGVASYFRSSHVISCQFGGSYLASRCDFLSCVRCARFARMHASGLPHSLNV
jgi:hypothetical protein